MIIYLAINMTYPAVITISVLMTSSDGASSRCDDISADYISSCDNGENIS